MKKISLMLLALGLSCGSAYAAHMDETPMPVSNDLNVTAPDQDGTWTFTGSAVLLQPAGDSFNYAYVPKRTSLVANGNHTAFTHRGKIHSVDEDYHAWFGAGVTYHFPGHGRDVTLAYEGLHGDSDASTHIGDGFSSQANAGFTTLNIDPIAAKGKTDLNYDAVDLVFGQKMDVGTRVSLHPFMGLRYAHIDTEDKGSYHTAGSLVSQPIVGFGTNINATADATTKFESKFNGVGPRFGSDAQVNLGAGFSVRGRFGASALIGSSSPDTKVSASRTFSGNLGPVPVDSVRRADLKFDESSRTRVVPELDGRLGLNYTCDFSSDMALGIEAGWQATDYFHAVEDSSVNRSDNNENFALQGPYLNLSLDVA